MSSKTTGAKTMPKTRLLETADANGTQIDKVDPEKKSAATLSTQ
jgi:hypothetical protein